MRKFEPLKGKRRVLSITTSPIDWNFKYDEVGCWFEDRDVRSAVRWLKKQIRGLRQSDGFIGTDFGELAGFIDMAFQDVIENEKEQNRKDSEKG